MKRTIQLGTAALAGGAMLLGLSGCSKQAYLTTFEDCEELETYIEDMAVQEYTWNGGGFSGGWRGGVGMPGADMALEGNDGGATNAHSTTNLQEAAVDEGDFVKNDGAHIYILNGDELAIIDAWPASDMNEISRIGIEGHAEAMYLVGDVVAVLSQLFDEAGPQGDQVVTVDKFVTKITLIDVADRTNPKVQREVYTEGTLFDSRRVEQRLYLITQRDLGDTVVREESWDLTRKEIKDRVQERELRDWMPRKIVNNKENSEWALEETQNCACTDVYKPNRDGGLMMMSVLALQLDDPRSEVTGTSVLAGSAEVYASADNLYLAVYEPNDGPFRVTSGGFGSRIHKFDLEGGPAHPIYEASGRVDGYVHNSFAMDEVDDTFRVATTSTTGTGESSSGVYVLEQDDVDLNVIGSVTNIAPGEEVYAVRFVDDAAYVVTFLQIDPLFTIDLTDPTAPEIMGELHVTGFSTYLHPMDDDHLIAVGEEIGADGWEFLGIQVSLFDVGDMTNPTMDDRVVIDTGWSESPALSDHHAFMYYEPLDMLSVPVTFQGWDWGDVSFSGLHIYDVTAENGFEFVGAMDASPLIDSGVEDYYANYCSQIRRTVVIEDVVYGVAANGIIAAPADTPDQSLAILAFPSNGGCDDPWGWWDEGAEW